MNTASTTRHRRGKLPLVVALSLALVMAPVLLPSALAYTHHGARWQGTNISWAEGGGDFSGNVGSALGPAASSWNPNTDVTLTKSTVASLTAVTYYSATDGLNGKAQWTTSNGYFTGCYASVNRSNVASWAVNKIRAVWTHEFGHCLGLGHTTSIAIMTGSGTNVQYDAYGIYTPPDR